jgi:hypothetical protein|tara:strand:+ start:677 stop:1300 length:624 start_codon:yes stop_codon:yes gene_type:complete
MMAARKQRTILERQLEARAKLWPELKAEELWTIDSEGWAPLPRLMPLMMSIMDDMSGKGFPVSRTYLELWSRLREERFLTLNRPEEMAFHAGFEGQRALRTWKDRVQRLHDLGFIELKDGPLGDLSYAVFYNPYYVIKRAHLNEKVQDRKWQALIIRANELSIFDPDDVGEDGKLIVKEDEDESEAPKKVKASPKRKPRKRVLKSAD